MEENKISNEETLSLEGASPYDVAKTAADFLDAKKGKDVKILHIEDKSSVADYFVLCTGTSGTHVKALAGELEYRMELCGVKPYHVEGRDNNLWIAIDYCNVIVHIFNKESREFYNIDKLYKNTTDVSAED